MRWPLVIGSGLSLVSLAWLVTYDPYARPPQPSPPQPPAPGGTWVALDGDAADLVTGVRYRACVRYSFISPLNVVSVAKVTSLLESAGFTSVRVLSGASPPNWPKTKCDWYVDATWSGAGKRMDRPSVVEFAWRWVDAK